MKFFVQDQNQWLYKRFVQIIIINIAIINIIITTIFIGYFLYYKYFHLVLFSIY